MSVPESPLLTIRDAAVLLGRGRSQVAEAVRQGQIPSVAIGKRSYIARHQIDLLIGKTERDDQ